MLSRDMDEFLTEVLALYEQKKWKELLDLNRNSDNLIAQKLLWVWPSEENLCFIKKSIEKNGLQGIISVGCGCGLLEWFIQISTGFPVIGLEVNKEWWFSKYSNPKFLDLQFPEMPPSNGLLQPNYGLLFCYFNDRQAFTEYMNCYEGNLVIIIGPGVGKGRHTDPEPFKPDFHNPDWVLDRYQEVKNSKDFIAVYVKLKKVLC